MSDLGKHIFCRVTGTNAYGSDVAYSNVVGPVVAVAAPVNTVAPALSSTTATVGTALTCSQGTWINPVTSYAYQWRQVEAITASTLTTDGGEALTDDEGEFLTIDETFRWAEQRDVDVPGATTNSYTPVSGDIGKQLYCRVTATGAGGSTSANSNVSNAVAIAGPPTTNLYLWLKADTGTFQTVGGSVASASNDPVGQWQDQSGGGRHFAQATVGKLPTLQTNVLNGKPVLRFVHANEQHLIGPSAAGLTAGEAFIVVKALNDPSGAAGEGGGLWTGDSVQSNYYPYADGDVYEGWGAGAAGRRNIGDPSFSLAAWRLYNCISTPTEWSAYFDGAATPFFTTGTNTVGFSSTVYLGSGDGIYFSGDIAEVIIYSAKCSAPDKAAVHAYLKEKYNLAIP